MKFGSVLFAASLPILANAADFMTGTRISEDTFEYDIEKCTDANPCSMYLVRLSDLKRLATIFERKAGRKFTVKIQNVPSGTYIFEVTGGEDRRTRMTTQFTYHTNLVTTGTGTTSTPSGSGTTSSGGSTGTSTGSTTGPLTSTPASTSAGGGSTTVQTGSLTSTSVVETSKTSETSETSGASGTKGPSTTSAAPSATTTAPSSGVRAECKLWEIACIVMVMQWLLI